MKSLILFIYVNGTETKVTVKTNQTIRTIAKRALKQTELAPRPRNPVADWMMVYKDRTLGFDEKINSVGIKTHEQLFLVIKAGIGG